MIAAEAGERDRDRTLVAGRAQPHVDRVERPFEPRRGERGDEGVRRADVILAHRHPPLAAALGHPGRMVIDQHEVEIGAGQHLPPARLAERDHHHAAAAHPAVARGEIGEHARQQRRHRRIGQRGASLAGLVDADTSLQHRDVEAEFLAPHRAADDLDRLLEQRRVGELRLQRAERRGIRLVRREQALERARHVGEMVGERGRGAEHGGDAVEQRRVALEQRQQLHPGGQAGEETLEPDESLVRLLLPPERGEQRRQHLAHQLARPLRAHRAHPPGLPAAHRSRDPRGVAEAEPVQRRDGARRRLAARR